jgi:hypothetical protein
MFDCVIVEQRDIISTVGSPGNGNSHLQVVGIGIIFYRYLKYTNTWLYLSCRVPKMTLQLTAQEHANAGNTFMATNTSAP